MNVGTISMLRWCWGGVEVVLRWCWSGVELVLRWCWAGVEVVLRWCWGGVEVVFLGYIPSFCVQYVSQSCRWLMPYRSRPVIMCCCFTLAWEKKILSQLYINCARLVPVFFLWKYSPWRAYNNNNDDDNNNDNYNMMTWYAQHNLIIIISVIIIIILFTAN